MITSKITSFSFGEIEKKINQELVKVEFDEKDVKGKFSLVFYEYSYDGYNNPSVTIRARANQGSDRAYFADITVEVLQKTIEAIVEERCGKGSYVTKISNVSYENSILNDRPNYLQFMAVIAAKQDPSTKLSW